MIGVHDCDVPDAGPVGQAGGQVPGPSPAPSDSVTQDQPEADVELVPDQLVLGEHFGPTYTARFSSASGCVSRSFIARVRGVNILRVQFTLDGKRLHALRIDTGYMARIQLRKLKQGIHWIVAVVRFSSSSGGAQRTYRSSFARCGKRPSASGGTLTNA